MVDSMIRRSFFILNIEDAIVTGIGILQDQLYGLEHHILVSYCNSSISYLMAWFDLILDSVLIIVALSNDIQCLGTTVHVFAVSYVSQQILLAICMYVALLV